jgi:PAS domain S-box-containing protein
VTVDVSDSPRPAQPLGALELRFYAHALRSIRECVSITDLEDRVLFVNEAFERTYGLSAAELHGRQISSVRSERNVEAVVSRILPETLRGGWQGEIWNRRRDGTEFPLLLSTSPIRDDHGQPIALVGVAWDLTDTRVTQDALRRRHQFLAGLHETALHVMERRDPTELLRALLDRGSSLFAAEHGFAYLRAGDADVMELRLGRGLFQDPAEPHMRRGEGFSGHVWERASPQRVDDYDAWPHRSASVPHGVVGPMIGAPLQRGTQVVGVLGLARSRGGAPFEDEELELLTSFARLSSVAVESAQLFADEREARTLAERLHAASVALSSTIELQEVLGIILRELQHVVPYDSASVQEMRDGLLHIVGAAGFGDVQSVLGVSFDPWDPANPNLAAAVGGRRAVVLEDAWSAVEGFRREPHAQAGVRSWLGVPLVFQGEVVGLLTLDRREPGCYREEHARQVTAFASQAALALTHARLFASARRDLEERRRAEAALRASEARYRQFVESAPDAIYSLDREGRVTYMNPVGLKLLGRTEAEVVGRAALAFVQDDDRPAVHALFESQQRGEVPDADYEFRVKRKDTVDAWLAAHVRVVEDGGQAVGFQAVGRDITERKRAQLALERERKQLHSIVGHAPVAMAILDRQARYVAHSERWLKYWGIAGRDLVGRSHFEMFPDLPAVQWEAVQRALAGEVVAQPEDLVEGPGGQRMWMRWSLHPWRGAAGGIDGIVVAVHNIDPLVKARQAALDAARLKSELLASMSHEIRTPMNAVLGLTRLLLDTPLDAEQRSYAELVKGSGESLLLLLDDVLDVSKAEAGRLVLEQIGFDLPGLLEDTAATFAERAASRGLELVCSVDPDLPRRAVGDPTRLRQVLVNLLGNALKFTEHGEVVLHASASVGEGRIRLRVAVRDTGPGIGPEVRERLFQSYVQGDAATSRRFGGTGLGLVICRRIVEQMGGFVGVESQPGAGSTFTFEVDLARDGEGALPGPPAPLVAHVLLVDDNESTLGAVRRQLEAMGVVAVTATGAGDGLRLLQRAAVAGQKLDAALVDAGLPAGGARRLVEDAVSEGALAAGRALFLDVARSSALADSSGGALAPSGGGLSPRVPVVMKPVRTASLRAALGELLGGQAPVVAASRAEPGGAGPRARLLVVEDNDINQIVAVKTLEKMGYVVDVASDGEQAVAACSAREYGLVLMDCVMPVMDGYQATSVIRSRESGRRTPIVAMTASALAGERERCLAAGMDDYVSKPFDPDRLSAVLARWTRTDVAAQEAPSASPAPARGIPRLDTQLLGHLRSLDGGAGRVLRDVVERFLKTSSMRLQEVQEAAAAGDGAAVARHAHGLRGVSGTVGALALADVCGELERAASSGTGPIAAPLLDALASECNAVGAELRAQLGA